MRNHIIYFLLLTIMLVACGDEEEAGLQSSNQDSSEAPTATPPPASSEVPVDSPLDALPADPVEGLDFPALEVPGRLLMVVNDTLYSTTFEGAPAAEVATGVTADLVLSPDRTKVAVPTNALTIYDTSTLEVVVSMALQQPAFVRAWSPDSRQVAFLSGGEAMILGVNDSLIELGEWNFVEIAWDLNGEIILGTYDFRANQTSIAQILRYTSQEPAVLLDNSDYVHEWDSLLDAAPELSDLGYQIGLGYVGDGSVQVLIDGTMVRAYRPAGQSAAGLCDTWTVRVDDQTVYEVEDTHALGGLSPMRGGSLTLARYYKPDCNLSSQIMVEAVQLWPGEGRSAVIAEGMVINDTTLDFFSQQRQLYALSPEGRYVAWIGGSEPTTLHIRDLAMETEAVIAVTPGLRTLLWVPE